MNQCGYCHRNNWRNNWILVPVIVVSRGKQIDSHCHKTCLSKWQKIAEVRINTDVENRFEREIAEQTKVYVEQIAPQQMIERSRRYDERMAGKRKCVDCGAPIHRQSTRCNSCHTTYQHREFRNPK